MARRKLTDFFRSSTTTSDDPTDAAGKRNPFARLAALLLGAYLLVCLGLGLWWSSEPDSVDVMEQARANATSRGHEFVTGYATTDTVISLARTLLDKRGGYLSNDVMPPGVWLDNIPNWEFGVLTQLRDVSRSFRIDFSRTQTQSTEDPDLSIAEGKFFFDNSSWAFPPSEREYEEAIGLFSSYLARLVGEKKPHARFYARADNLNQWLQGVETRLGSLSQRLSASVGKRDLVLATPMIDDPESVQRDPGFKTPWLEIDDVFYEARGQAWALMHLLQALEHDFADVLADKNARVAVQQIIRELEPTQGMVWSPIILNGSGLGLVANHSLVMGSYISRANAGISDLRRLLAQG